MTESVWPDRLDARVGPQLIDGGCRFRIWAPLVAEVQLHVLEPEDRLLPMKPLDHGYHEVIADGVSPGARYLFRLPGGEERADPASRFQPEGVHGPSEVIDESFAWSDSGWAGITIEDLIIYELHVGLFTPNGTFEALIETLDELVELGITAVEIMPVSQFSGDRNWGYDGVFAYAVQNSYGGPAGFKRLVDECHSRGLAVILDVVYNHFGPEGSPVVGLAPYFTDLYRTPWGEALNFDGPGSDEVRAFFGGAARYFLEEFHLDGFRLDATHAILDTSSTPFLAELADAKKALQESLGRYVHLIAENSENDSRIITSREGGGIGLDAIWSEDFHHSLRTLVTGEDAGYFQDYGRLDQLAKAFQESFVYTGDYSEFRRRRYGAPAGHLPPRRFVVCAKNHDQVANRVRGERLSSLVSFEELKLIAGVVLTSPFVPLLFMGEEYSELAPFLYFVSHQDPDLAEAVRLGRQAEFEQLGLTEEPPDPTSETTFLRSKLDRTLRKEGNHRLMWDYYRELMRIRHELPAFRSPTREDLDVKVSEPDRSLAVRRFTGDDEAVSLFHFGSDPLSMSISAPGEWGKVVDSSDRRWGGPGSSIPEVVVDPNAQIEVPRRTFVLFAKQNPS